MKIRLRTGLLLLCSCALVSCLSVGGSPISTDEENAKGVPLHGYLRQTIFRGKEYRLTYGELQIQGTLNTEKPSGLEGAVPRGVIPFRGNAKYKLDFALGANKLQGVIAVEATGIRIDMRHSNFLISGFMDDRTNRIQCDVVMGHEKVQGIYTVLVDTRQNELRNTDYSFQLDNGDFLVVGHIGYKNNLTNTI